MTDAPERIWLGVQPTDDHYGFAYNRPMRWGVKTATPYVPEARLEAAEARHRAELAAKFREATHKAAQNATFAIAGSEWPPEDGDMLCAQVAFAVMAELGEPDPDQSSLDAMLAEARAEGIREAARIAKDWPSATCVRRSTGERIENAILALLGDAS